MWVDALDEEHTAAAEALLARAQDADGVAAVSEQALPDVRADATLRAVRTVDGAVAGYAHLTLAHGDHSAMAEVAVDPRWRGRGIGTELVAAAMARGGDGARVWAHGDLPAARRVAARLRLRPARELWQMRRSLVAPELPPLQVPDDITLRSYAGPADDADLLRVNNAAFAWHPEQGNWTVRELRSRRAEPWFDPAGLFIAVSDGQMLGFHWTKVHLDGAPSTPPTDGEVYVVAVDPTAQGRGVGRLLTLAGLRFMRDQGLRTVLLYTEADNVAAVRTYEKLGFGRYRADIAYAAN